MKSYLANFNFLKIFFLFFLTLEYNNVIFSEAFSVELKEFLDPLEKIKEIENSYSKMPYLIDSGDVLGIEFGDVTIFTGNYPVDRDGYINLPEFGKIFVRKISIIEFEELLNSMYVEYINKPDINVYISIPREVNVYVKGEVNFPGLYQLKYNQINIEQNRSQIMLQDSNLIKNSGRANINKPPRIFNALQATKGLKPSADISKITVIRNESNLNGGGMLKTEINFLSLLDNGDQSQNIELRDKDVIIIPKSDKIVSQKFFEINKTNITPNEMVVFVNGNVAKKGAQTVPKNSSLNEVLSYSGGVNMSQGRLEFLRIVDKGKLKRKILKYDLEAPRGSKNNPILINGDVIMARKNIVGKVTSGLQEFGSPAINAYGIYKLFFD